MNVEKKLNGNQSVFESNTNNIISLFINRFSLRIELQDAEANDLAGSKDSRRRQR